MSKARDRRKRDRQRAQYPPATIELLRILAEASYMYCAGNDQFYDAVAEALLFCPGPPLSHVRVQFLEWLATESSILTERGKNAALSAAFDADADVDKIIHGSYDVAGSYDSEGRKMPDTHESFTVWADARTPNVAAMVDKMTALLEVAVIDADMSHKRAGPEKMAKAMFNRILPEL